MSVVSKCWGFLYQNKISYDLKYKGKYITLNWWKL